MKSMKIGKAWGPSGVTSDLVKAAGAAGVNRVFQVYEFIEQEGEVPEQWCMRYTIPVYKGKGGVLMVDKQRGMRLLEQKKKVYEITLEKGLRDVVNRKLTSG